MIKPVNKNQYYVSSVIELGDLVWLMFLMENVGKTKGLKMVLSVDEDDYRTDRINDIVDLEFLKVKKCKDGIPIIKHYRKSYTTDYHFNQYTHEFFSEKYGTINFSLPHSKIERSYGKDVLCQFDCRTKKQFPLHKAKKIVKHVNGIAIGGLDTQKYLGDSVEYRLGDIQYIASQLSSCKFFIGADSGISHMAGLLGIESYVIFKKQIRGLIEKVYPSYPNTKLITEISEIEN